MPNWLQLILSPITHLFRRALQPADVAIIDRYRDELAQMGTRLDRCEERHRRRDLADEVRDEDIRKLREELATLRDNFLQFEKGRLSGLLTIDDEGTILTVNQDMAVIIELPIEKIVGRPCHDIIPHRYRGVHDQKFRQVVAGDLELRAGPLETLLLTGSGHEVPITIRSLARWMADGKPQYTAQIIRR